MMTLFITAQHTDYTTYTATLSSLCALYRVARKTAQRQKMFMF